MLPASFQQKLRNNDPSLKVDPPPRLPSFLEEWGQTNGSEKNMALVPETRDGLIALWGGAGFSLIRLNPPGEGAVGWVGLVDLPRLGGRGHHQQTEVVGFWPFCRILSIFHVDF